jgi:hypothetical protein
MGDSIHAQRWSNMKLDRYDLAHANDALAAVASGAVLKALIDPRGKWVTGEMGKE